MKMLFAVFILIVFSVSAYAGNTPEAWGQASSYEEIVQMERDLETRYRLLEVTRMTASEMIRYLEDELRTVWDADVQAFVEGRYDAISSPEVRTKLENIDARIRKWDAQQKTFQAAYHGLVQAKMDMVIDTTMNYMETVLKDLRTMVPVRRFSVLQKMLDDARVDYNKYKENRHQYGGPVDTHRLTPYTRFFQKAASFVERVDDNVAAGPVPLRAAWRKVVKMTRYVGLFAGAAITAPRELYELVRALRSPPESERFQGGQRWLYRLFLRLAKVRGYDVKVHGEENIPASSENTLVILAPNHTQMMRDMYTLSAFGGHLVHQMLAFSATHAQPKPLREAAANMKMIIPVGKGYKPIEIFTDRITNDGFRNAAIYPEGTLSGPLGELRPVRAKFVMAENAETGEKEGLLYDLLQSGWNVNYVPVSSPDGYSFFTQDNFFDPIEEHQKVLDLHVRRPITRTMLRMLVKDSTPMQHMIPGLWMDDMITDSTRLFGQFRIAEVTRRIVDYVHGHFVPPMLKNCRALLEGIQRSVGISK